MSDNVTPIDRARAELDRLAATTAAKPPAPYELWERYALERPDKGPPYATASNVVRVLNGSPEFSSNVIWYDTFRERVLTTWRAPPGRSREWSDEDDACLLVHLQSILAWHKLSSTAIHDGLRAFLQGRRRNPLLEYLDGLTWDGIERLPTFLSDTYDTPQDAYHEAVGRCWLISMVARARRPGCQVDTIPVLEGAQGIRKSTSLEILGGEFYTSLPRGFGDVEFLQVMEGCWLGEIPDMASFRGRDLEHIKAFITIREDRYRRKYARRAMTRQRQCVFAATDNSGDWNGDVTGARRFWPFVCKTVNIDYLKANRDQLFAEALARLNRGEVWWDVPVGDQVEQAEERRHGDAWEIVIAKYVHENPNREREETYWHPRKEPLEELTVSDLLEVALNIPPARWDRSSQMRVASALKALGWRRSRRGSTGKRYWAYVRPDLTGQEGLNL
jgi:predicted P-loop ATPase